MGKNFRETLNKQMANPEFKAEYDALEPVSYTHLELLGDLADRHAGFAFGNELDHVHLVDGDVQPLFFQFVLLQDLHIAIDLHQKLVCFRRKAGHAAHSFRPFVPFFDKFS